MVEVAVLRCCTNVFSDRVAEPGWRARTPAKTCLKDLFFIRKFLQSIVLSYLGTDLLQVVRPRPLASVAVNRDRYSVGYSAAWPVSRLSRVFLDDPQSTCWQYLPKWGQMAFTDIQNVRLAADADSYRGGSMACRPVKDPVLHAYVAGTPSRASSRCGHDSKCSCHLLIRRLLRERRRPGQMPSDVPGRGSLVRIIDLRCASLSGQNPASPVDTPRGSV